MQKLSAYLLSLFRKKQLDDIVNRNKGESLKKTLTAFDLILIGIGGIIGVGIFVVTGKIAANISGPAISLSFVLAGVICTCTALVYGELATLIPVSGGAYTFNYVVMGEFFAWIIGCCIIIVTSLGSCLVAVGWSGYLVGGLESAGIVIPQAFQAIPSEGGIVNVPAIFIVALITSMLIRGTKESVKLNNILVLVKMLVIATFLVFAFPHFQIKNWDNYMPYGINGVITGAASIFLAFAGFEQIASAAEETKNPKRDLPIGICGSVIIVTIVYVTIGSMLTGIVDFKLLDNTQPIAFALRENGVSIGSTLVTIGALGGMPAVILANIFGLSRVVFSMSRDGIVPSIFAKLDPKTKAPKFALLFSGAIIALLSGLAPIELIADIMNIALLVVFASAALCAMVMRFKHPEMERPFKCPMLFFLASVTMLSCLYLIVDLCLKSDYAIDIIGVTAVVIVAIYKTYGHRNSLLNPKSKRLASAT